MRTDLLPKEQLQLAQAATEFKQKLFAYPKDALLRMHGRVWLEEANRTLRAIQRRIKENGWKYYVPQPYQLPFHESMKRHRVVYGGNRTGKTLAGIAEMIFFARGEHPYKPDFFIPVPVDVIICSQTTKTMRMFINPYIFKFLPRHEVDGIYYIKNEIIDYIRLKNGSRIYLMSYDQGRERLQGVSAFAAHMDEEPDEDYYREMLMRLLDQEGYLWMTLTPLSGLTWVYDTLYMNPDADPEYQDYQWDIRDNITLSQKEVERILAKYPEDVREARARGQFIGLSGLVYPWLQYGDAFCDPFEIPSHWQRVRVIDPSISGMTACLWVAIDPYSNLWLYKEYYKSGLTVSEHCQRIRALSVGETYNFDIIDSAAMQPNPETMKTTYQLYMTSLYDEEKRSPLVLARKEIVPGIETTLEYMAAARHYVDEQPFDHPYIRVFSTLTNFRDEARKYRWAENKSGALSGVRQDKPLHKSCHLMDCLRYACHYDLRYYNTALAEAKRKLHKHRVDPVTGY